MMRSERAKARLFMTYLKDKIELYLYKKPNGTQGSSSIYRRSPGDAAMHVRIETLLDICGVLRSEVEIWVILYPPEIHTTTFYVATEITDDHVVELVHEQILFNNPYFIHYDRNNFLMQRRENGHGKDMVTVAFVGKKVLPRIRSLLYRDYGKVNFLGDGLQFLAVDEEEVPDIRGSTYEIVLPYGETFYKAVFRSGVHFESVCHPKHNAYHLGAGKLNPEQVYLSYELKSPKLDLPMLLPLVHRGEWKEAYLTPAAFPLWYIAQRTMHMDTRLNFAELLQKLASGKDKKASARRADTLKDLD